MGAQLYIASLYEKRRDEYKLEDLRAEWIRLLELPATPENVPALGAAWKAYNDAGNQALADCHFGDPYNQRNLFWLFDMDYWTEGAHVENGAMPVSRLKVLRDKLVTGDVPALVARAIENGHANQEMPPGSRERRRPELVLDADTSLESIVTYFEAKRDTLVKMFDTAIALNEGVRWSGSVS